MDEVDSYSQGQARSRFLESATEFIEAVQDGKITDVDPEILALCKDAIEYRGVVSGPAFHPSMRPLLDAIAEEQAVFGTSETASGQELLRQQAEANKAVDRIVDRLAERTGEVA